MSQRNPDASLKQFKMKLAEAALKKKESALKSLISDNFEFVDAEGAIIGKQQLIQGMVSEAAKLPDITFDVPKTQTLVRNTLIRETETVRIEGELAGQEVSGYYVYTALYLKKAKDWQLASVNLTKRSVKGDVAHYVAMCSAAAASKDEAGLQELFHPDYYLVDDKGNVLTRQQVLDSVLHSDTAFAGFKYENALRTDYQYEGDTIREVSVVNLAGQYVHPATLETESIGDQYIYTATYVKGPKGLQIIANTMTAKK